MPEFRDKTAMGGDKDAFQTTCWTEIHDAGTDDEDLRTQIIGNLLQKYWKPVYCHLRHKGYSNESAKDLTQGFFCKLVLSRELVLRADKSKGRFRTFLLTALDRYATNVYRKETAAKRSPAGVKVSLEVTELPELSNVESEVQPEQVFHYAWASELLDQALTKVKEDCYSTGRATHWEVFSDRVLASIFDDSKTLSMPEICARHGIDSEAKASNMIVTVKRRFRTVLRNCLRRFVQTDSEVEGEFNELIKILSKK